MAHANNEEELERRRALRHESRTGQTFRKFITEVQNELRVDPKQAEQAAISVVCLLEQRLIGEEAQDMNAQLPQKFVEELLQRCPIHKGKPRVKFGADDFIAQVASELGISVPNAITTIQGVFTALSKQVSFGEIDDVIRELPVEFRDLFPKGITQRVEREQEQERWRAQREHMFEPEPAHE